MAEAALEHVSSVTSKRQVAIPKDLCELAGVPVPGRVRWEFHEGALVMRPLLTIEELAGVAKAAFRGQSAVASLRADRRKEREDDERRSR